MSLRTFFVCLVQCLLLLLCLVPLACALGTERPLPDTLCPQTGVNSATAVPSIDDVWMKNGGARLYYSALYGARQQYTGGATRIDPACTPLLPPLRAWGTPETKKPVKVRRSARAAAKPKPAASPCPDVDKAVEAAKVETRAKVEAELKAEGKAATVAKSKAADGASSTSVQKATPAK